jgi:hypothetical protein
MKNSLELQVRALRSPRVLKQTDAGEPELIDVWAIHHCDRSSLQWAIAVKFGREAVAKAAVLKTGTLFTVKGRLDQSKNPKTGSYHTFLWADDISDVVQSKKRAPLPSNEDEAPELNLPEAGQEETTPQT